MKNIAILIPTIKAGGAEKQAAFLAAMLSKRYKVSMYLFLGYLQPAPHNLKLLESTNVSIYPLEGTIWKKIRDLTDLLKKNETDVIFNYMTNCDVIGCISAKIAGVKLIYGGIRNAYLERYKIIFERIICNYFSTSVVFICYSGLKEIGKNGFKEERCVVIPNCFPNISEPIFRKDKDKKHIVTVGRFVPQKDYLTIIRSVAELKKLRRDFIMDVIGYGEEEENIRRWIKEYGVDDMINIHINPNNVQEIVKSSDIYLSTSLFEGTSNSIMEALNWSLPVVATNVGDNNYLVLDGKTGFLHPIGDYKGIASSLSTLLEDIDLRNSYGVAGNQNLRDNYSIEVFEQRYLKLIEV